MIFIFGLHLLISKTNLYSDNLRNKIEYHIITIILEIIFITQNVSLSHPNESLI